jgi:hypothetical protein
MYNQDFPTNRNSLLGRKAKPGGATGVPLGRHRGRQAEGRPKKILFLWGVSDPETISNNMKQSN